MALQVQIVILLCIFPGIHFSSQSQIPRIKKVLVWKHFIFIYVHHTHTHTHTHTPICGCCCESVSKSCPTLWPHGLQHARLPCPSLSPTFAQIHVHLVNDTIQPSHSLSPLLLLPSVFPSLRIFSSELAFSIRWAKYWSFSFSISPSSEYSGLVSFSIDWFDLLAVQGTLKSLLQHHSLATSILRHSAFFMYGPTLTSIHDYWKDHSFDSTDLCWQSDVSALRGWDLE